MLETLNGLVPKRIVREYSEILWCEIRNLFLKEILS